MLRVPIAPPSLSVIRSVVGSVAIRADLTYEQIDDLRTAVGEAASRLMLPGVSERTAHLSISLQLSSEGVEVEIWTVLACPEPLLPAGSLSHMIVHGLVDEVESRVDADGSLFRLVKRRSEV